MIGIRNRSGILLLLLTCLLTAAPAIARPRHPGPNSLGKNSRELFLTSMQWGDRSWQERAGLCGAPGAAPGDPTFPVRESTWYALGLLLRDQPGDRDRRDDRGDGQRNPRAVQEFRQTGEEERRVEGREERG